jgi:hypothetical protein
MGSIMCLGVSVSNSVMLVAFMDEHWKGGASSVEAAILGAGERLRPILMTACAMTVGMVPMALALEKGSEMQAPLGLAVIGGLVMSTFATLLVVPSIFAVVIGRKAYGSPSIYPDDRESKYHDPNVFAGEADHGEPARDGDRVAHAVVGGHTDDEIIGFLGSMLHEIQVRRHDMVTHHTADDLLGPLGFATDDTSGEGAQAPDGGPSPGEVEAPGYAPQTDKDSSSEGL